MKKIVAYSLFFLLCPIVIFSQGVWSACEALPSANDAMVQGIPGFSVGNFGYGGLGENGSGQNLSSFWQFDPSTNSWLSRAIFPGSARIAPACFVVGNSAYIVTGATYNGGPCVNECWKYDAITDTWIQKANFPGSVRAYAVGFTIDSLGYVGTGADELADFCKDFYAYHPSTDTWTRIADFGGFARSAASGFSVNKMGYVCFGWDSTKRYYGDMWEYNPIVNTWTKKSNIPTFNSPHAGASGFVMCNNIYVGSGVDTFGVLNPTFWRYNPTGDIWTQLTSVPGLTKIEGAAFAIADTGYYGFGGGDGGTIYNIFNKFNAPDSCNSFTGINSISDKSTLKVYPNPNNGIFKLAFSPYKPYSKSLLVKVEIFNELGDKVYTENLPDIEGCFNINISTQPDGIYLYRVTTLMGTLVGTGKFSIQ